MKIKGSLKDCFWTTNSPVKLGLMDNDFWFNAKENSFAAEVLLKNDWFLKGTTCTPFCVGTLDERLTQDSGVYVGASSSGSVLDIESGVVDFSIATDTGGSTIAPAARAHLYGFKPTYGRISRYGLNPLCSPLDVVSIMSCDLSIIKLVYSKLDKCDPRDQTNLPLEQRTPTTTLGEICIPVNLFSKESISKLTKLYPYAKLTEFNVPPGVIEGAYLYLLCPDFYSNMAKFDGVTHKYNDKSLVLDYKPHRILSTRDKLSTEIKSRVQLGVKLLMGSYDSTLIDKFRSKIQSIIKNESWVFPVSPREDLYTNDLSYTSYCILSNLLRRPSITVPNDLPEGYFIMTPPNTDYLLLDFFNSK